MEPLQAHGIKVGDIVRRKGTKHLWKVIQIYTWKGEATDLASLDPVRKDGKRHRRRTPISGTLKFFEKVCSVE